MAEILQQAFDAVTQWPVIVQGALGSALFALLSYLGQILFRKAMGRLAQFSQTIRKENLYREYFHKKHSRMPGRADSIMLLSIFQASSYVARGLIFLGLGWLLDGIIPLSFKIGVLGFLYYVFWAVLWLDRFTVEKKESDLRIWARVKEIEVELFGKPSADTLAKLAELSSPNPPLNTDAPPSGGAPVS